MSQIRPLADTGRGSVPRPIVAIVTDQDDGLLLAGWSFSVQERSIGNYEVTGTHTSGASVRVVGDDPDALLIRCRSDAASLLG